MSAVISRTFYVVAVIWGITLGITTALSAWDHVRKGPRR